jgi:hypothetical protein
MWVSSLHQNISFKRAFNPILGETYEGYFCLEWDNDQDGAPDQVNRYETNNFLIMRQNTQRATSQPSNLK